MRIETAVVAFVDHVDASESAFAIGETAAAELHREMLAFCREAVVHGGGKEVESVGGRVMALFPTAGSAIDAMVAMHQRIDARNRRSNQALVVRVGIGAGDVTEDNGDYYGSPVVEATKCCELASGGQILVSEIVKSLSATLAQHTLVAMAANVEVAQDEILPVYEVVWEPMPVDNSRVALPVRLVRSETAVFAGRRGELAAFEDVIKEAFVEQRRQLVLLSGEAGIGKTTLMARVASAAHAQGATVLYGRCDEGVSSPYQPWADAFGSLVEHGVVDGPVVELLGPLLGRRSRVSFGADGSAERSALFQAALEALAQPSHEDPLIVILDDLHWADAPTVSLLRWAARTEVPMGVVLVACFRDEDTPRNHPLADLLVDLHRQPRVQRMSLGGLDDLGVLEMMESVVGQGPDGMSLPLRDALVTETDGNPFFVEEMLRHLTETGAISVGSPGQWLDVEGVRASGLPRSLREVLNRRAVNLGEETRRTLGVASVVGQDFDAYLVAEVAGLEIESCLDRLESGERAGLLVELPGHFAFAHVLVGRALYDGLGSSRRSMLHRRIAEAIEQGLPTPNDRTAELAHHWSLASGPDVRDKSVRYALLAGDEALSRLAPEDALRWYQQVIDTEDLAEQPRLLAQARVGIGEAQHHLGAPEYLGNLLEGGRVAHQCQDTDLLVRAALGAGRGWGGATGAIVKDLVELLELALADTAHEESARRAHLLAVLATEVYYTDLDRAALLAREAIALAQQLGSPETLAEVVPVAVFALLGPDAADEYDQLSALGLEKASAVGNSTALDLALASRLYVAYGEGDLASIDDLCHRRESLNERFAPLHTRWILLCQQSARAALAGDASLAEELATKAFELGMASEQPDAMSMFGGQLSVVRAMQGRAGELVEMLVAATQDNPGIVTVRLGLALFLIHVDRHADAAEVLSPDLESNFATIRRDLTWTGGMHMCAEAVAALGLKEPASALYSQLLPYADQVPCNSVVVFEVLHWGLGRLATVLGRYDDAQSHFAKAEEVHLRLEAPYFLARTHWAWAELLVTRGRPGDQQRSLVLAEQARSAAVSQGYGRIEMQSQSLLDHLK